VQQAGQQGYGDRSYGDHNGTRSPGEHMRVYSEAVNPELQV
jgi:hypothetical protein